MAIDPNRLYTALLNTGLQNKDPRLYQVIHDLIGQIAKLTPISLGGSGAGSGTTIINQPISVIQMLGDSDSSSDDGSSAVIPGNVGPIGPQGQPGINGQDGEDADLFHMQSSYSHDYTANRFFAGDGNNLFPGYSFAGNHFDGIYRVGTGVIAFSLNGSPILLITSHAELPSTSEFRFTQTADVVGQRGNTDVGVKRYRKSVLGVSAGDLGVLTYPIGGTLFDHFASVGNTTVLGADDTLYSDSVVGNTFAANGDKLLIQYGGTFVSSGTATREIKLWFAGSVIFDTGALTLSLSSSWNLQALLIRVSATVIRYSISFSTEGAALASYTSTGELTGLTLTGANTLLLAGAANGVGAAANDIVAKLGTVIIQPGA